MVSTIMDFKLPLKGDPLKGWKAYNVFKGSTKNLPLFSCHISVLNSGRLPHPPHTHKEEEILLVLYGKVKYLCPKLEKSKILFLPQANLYTTLQILPAH